MMFYKLVTLCVCCLVFSITPVSALEMGGIESYSVPVTTTTSGGDGDVFGINNPMNMSIEAVSTKNRSENNSNNSSSVKKSYSWGGGQ